MRSTEEMHPNTEEWIHEIVKLGGVQHGYEVLGALQRNGGDPFFCSRCGDTRVHPWAYVVALVPYRALYCTTCLLVDERDKDAVFLVDEQVTLLVVERKFGGDKISADVYAEKEFGAVGRDIPFAADEWLLSEDPGRQLILDGVIRRALPIEEARERFGFGKAHHPGAGRVFTTAKALTEKLLKKRR